MPTIKIEKKSYPVPANWDELKQKQIIKIAIARKTITTPRSAQEVNTLKMLYFSVITEIPQWKQRSIAEDQWMDLLSVTDWLFNSPKFSYNPFPRIRVSMFMVLHGPLGFLETSSFAEFMNADNAFIDFHNNRNELAAFTLLATLWRQQRDDLKAFKNDPDNWNEDVRVPYNQSKCEVMALKLQKKKAAAPFAMMAIMYYESFRNQALTGNPRLKILFQGATTSRSKSAGLGWMQTLIAQSGSKFGDFNSTAKTNWLLVVLDVALKMEQQQNQQSNQ